MYSKDETDLIDSSVIEDEDEYYNQSYLEMKKEILDYAKSETVKKEVAKEVDKALEKGREENQKDVIVSSYKENIPAEIIAKICKTSLTKVNKIIKEYCL